MLLFHTTLPPPPLYLSLMRKTTPLPSHSQVLSFHKPKSQSHSSLSGSLAPLISNTSHCWLNLNHHQHQPPIISSTLFYLFIFQSNHSIHYPQSPPPRPPSSTHPLILKSVFFYHYVGLSSWVFGWFMGYGRWQVPRFFGCSGWLRFGVGFAWLCTMSSLRSQLLFLFFFFFFLRKLLVICCMWFMVDKFDLYIIEFDNCV